MTCSVLYGTKKLTDIALLFAANAFGLFMIAGVPSARRSQRKSGRFVPDTCRAAQAQYLVSRDGDLLDLPTASDRDSRRIREICPGLQIIDPATFLSLLQQRSK